jgi:hypothetical protein
MATPSRAEVFGEVIELREQLDAVRRAYDDDDLDGIGAALGGEDELEDEDADDELDDDLEDDELDD